MTSDIVYMIGGRIRRHGKLDWVYRLRRLRRRPLVVHWVGSDVLHALADGEAGRVSPSLVDGPVHLAQASWLADELAPLGIRARVLPFTTTGEGGDGVPSLPDRFTVLTYLPAGKERLYGQDAVLQLAEHLPDAHFLVAGRSEGGRLSSLSNVEQVGWVKDMGPVYSRATVLLRLTEHDGLASMVVEAMSYGRHVIWSHPLEGVLTAANADAARDHLRQLMDRHRGHGLEPNLRGREFVNQRYSPPVIRENLLDQFESLLARR